MFLGSLSSIAMNCSVGSEDSVCCPFGANSTILLLVKREEDMTSYLISLGISSRRGRRIELVFMDLVYKGLGK